MFKFYTAVFLSILHYFFNGENIVGMVVPPVGRSSRTTKMMAILMGTYYGFFSPAILNYHISYNPTVKIYVTFLVDALFYINAIVNPIIYAWMNKDFNEAFRKILHMKSRTLNGHVAVISNGRIQNVNI